jgi:hypothetical protein
MLNMKENFGSSSKLRVVVSIISVVVVGVVLTSLTELLQAAEILNSG